MLRKAEEEKALMKQDLAAILRDRSGLETFKRALAVTTEAAADRGSNSTAANRVGGTTKTGKSASSARIQTVMETGNSRRQAVSKRGDASGLAPSATARSDEKVATLVGTAAPIRIGGEGTRI